MSDRIPLKIRAAKWAGTVLRVTRRPAVALFRSLPGLAGAALAGLGGGEVAGHVFGRGLTPWVACVIAAVFLVRIGAEINAPAPTPRQPDD